jgi:hypothetical protein
MNKKVTQKRTYTDLLKNSLHELFAPSSPRSLIDYNELKLIKTKDLSLIDTKQLMLVNVAALTFFVQYVGALTMTLVFGLLLGVGMFGIQQTVSSIDSDSIAAVSGKVSRVAKVHALSFNNSVKVENSLDPVVANRYTRGSYQQKNITNSDGRKSLHTYNLESPVYTDQRPLGSYDYKPAVAGVSTQREINETTACSFEVKGSVYPDGSRYVPADENIEICAFTSKGQISWSVNDRASLVSDSEAGNSDGCISLTETAGEITASVNDNNGDSVGSCSLSLLALN